MSPRRSDVIDFDLDIRFEQLECHNRREAL